MEQDKRVIDDIAAAKIKLLLEAERNAANTMPPGLASNNSGGSTLANLLNPSLFRGGPAARGMAGRVLRPGIEAEDSLLNRTISGPGQVARNLGGSALAGLLGAPGDLNAMFPKPLQGALPLPTSEQLQDKFGVEANRPESYAGLLGAPDPMDLARAGGKGLLAMTLFHGSPHKEVKIMTDNPGGDWLKGQRKRAAETGNLGAVTGYLKDNKPVMVNPRFLEDIPGAMDEHLKGRGLGYKADAIRESLRSGEAIRSPIFITVDYNGKPLINEGNNRLAVAIQEGLTEVPVEIRWFAGGEEVPGPLSPDNLQKMVTETSGLRSGIRPEKVEDVAQDLGEATGLLGRGDNISPPLARPSLSRPGDRVTINGKTFQPQRIDRGDHTLVTIPRDKFISLLDNYGVDTIGPGPEFQGQIGNRIEDFREFLKNNDEGIEVARASFQERQGQQLFQFGDGRHRTRVMLEEGFEEIPIAIEKGHVSDLKKALENL